MFELLVILQCACLGFCANILIADNMPSPSHQIWNSGIAEGLLNRGHNVTMLSQPPPKTIKHKNFHLLSMEGLMAAVIEGFNTIDFAEMSTLQKIAFYQDYNILACNKSFQSKGFKMLMDYPKDFKFDIILIDLTVGDCFLPLIQRFNYPPTVGLTAFLIPSYLAYDFGNELQTSYIPNFYTSFSTEMNFLQRLENFIWTYTHIIYRDTYMKRNLKNMLVDAFGEHMDSLSDLNNHVSLLLANWNPILNHPQSIAPNIIPVGGSHIKPGKLPKDIQEIMDTSPNGVILFSLGSNVRSEDFSDDQRKVIIDTFSKLKETILWKFETNITGLPENVIVRKWLPQLELLAHPNLKLFISHCGGLSSIEASYFGVPVLGIPFIVDQHMNADNLVRKEVARKIDNDKLTTGIFLENINELLHNNKYMKNMKEISRKMKDLPLTPLDTAVFWIEYSIRHNGTHFLNPKSRYLPLFITTSADLYLFFISIIIILILILRTVYKIVKSIIKNKARTKSKNE